MKFTIAAIMIALAAPALADKMPAKPMQTVCSLQVAQLQTQIQIMKKELAALRQAEIRKPVPKPGKPVNPFKKV
jgi:hypothetical protein